MSFVILCVATLGGLAWYVMEPVERQAFIREVLLRLQHAGGLVGRARLRREPLQDVLRARTRFPVVTPMLVGASLAIFAGMIMGETPRSDPATLLEWGASYGPQTTNGEWWRLMTSTFVHTGLVPLAVNLAALISVGILLERLVGHLTFAAVFCVSAVLGGVASLSTTAVSVTAGGAPAIFGLYGLLLAAWAWGAFQGATTTIRLQTVLRLVPAAALFVLYYASGVTGLAAPEQAGLVTGFICGVMLARRLSETKPPARRLAVTTAAMVSIAMMTAAPLSGMTDVTPELKELVAMESRHASAYDSTVADFNRGQTSRKVLLDLMEGRIVPELAAAAARIGTLERVPPQHQVLVTSAQTYLGLRVKGWRLRATALRRSSMPMLREADAIERSALDALASFATSAS